MVSRSAFRESISVTGTGSWEPSRTDDMSIPITEPSALESNASSSDSNKDDNEQHENEPEHNDSNDNELNNKNNAMNNNIIHGDNPNSIGGGYTLNAGNPVENTADGSTCIGHDWHEIQDNRLCC